MVGPLIKSVGRRAITQTGFTALGLRGGCGGLWAQGKVGMMSNPSSVTVGYICQSVVVTVGELSG